jgi:hypothetical protein
MKFNLSQYKRRGLIPLAGLTLALYYVFVLVPLQRRASSLDTPLRNDWQKLALALDQTNARSLDFTHITNQLHETRQALQLLESAKQQVTARLLLGQKVRARMNAPFQLVEYQNERSKELDELAKLAKQEQVTLDPAVLDGLPEHTADVTQPELLWAALAMIDSLLTTTLHCKVTSIHSLEAPLSLTNPPPADVSGRLAEIPLQIEFTGPTVNIGHVLQSLPLRPDEIRAAGLPEVPDDKLPLFVDRLIIKKQTPDKPDEVSVSLRVLGFVLRE